MPNTPFLSEIFMAGFSFAPRGYAACNGQLLPINQNQALFSLLGTTFGGNGTTNFQLPDMRGRAPMGEGTGPGLSNRVIGERAGSESATLIASQIPAHNHILTAVTNAGNTASPTGAVLANTGAMDKEYNNSGTGLTPMNANSVNTTGGNQPHLNLQPFIVLNFYIALQGIFPSRT